MTGPYEPHDCPATERATPRLSGLMRTVAMLCTTMTAMVVLPLAGPGWVASAVAAAEQVLPVHLVYLLWIANAVLVLRIGLRQFPELPIWVGLMICTVGGAMIVGTAPALVATTVVAVAIFGLRLRRRAAVEARIAARLEAAGI